MTSRTVDINCGNCDSYLYSVGPLEKIPKRPSSCKKCARVMPAAGRTDSGDPPVQDVPAGVDPEKTG